MKVFNNAKIEDILIERYRINSSIKEYKGYKVKSPQETIRTIEDYFSRINLKVKYIPFGRNILERFTPFQSGFAVLTPSNNENVVLMRTYGKGVTPILSKASAVAELIERFSGYGMVSSGLIKHYLSQFKMESIWRDRRRKFNDHIGKLFSFQSLDASLILSKEDWKAFDRLSKNICFSLTRKKFYIYPEEFFVKFCGSNGLASGNTKEEAILHAIFECIERLVGLYFLDTLPKVKRINIESLSHPTLQKLIDAISNMGIKFEILDFSFVFGIPAFITIFDVDEWNLDNSNRLITSTQYPLFRIGVDTNPEDAIMRCFTELLQGQPPIYDAIANERRIRRVLSKISKVVDKYAPFIRDLLKTPSASFVRGNPPSFIDLRRYIKNCREKEPISEVKSIYDIDIKIELDRIVSLLKRRKIEILVSDVTNPLVPFPVALVRLEGGDDYFEHVPLNTYLYLVLGERSSKRRYSLIRKKVRSILYPSKLRESILSENWRIDIHQEDFISAILEDIYTNGIESPLWGVALDKLYLLSLFLIRMGMYNDALSCIDAALTSDINDIHLILTRAYICSKLDMKKDFEHLLDFAKVINYDNIDIKRYLNELDDPIIHSNPFKPCHMNCGKEKGHLCDNCFFNYVDEDTFMKNFLEEYL